jgi:hypothetical protein
MRSYLHYINLGFVACSRTGSGRSRDILSHHEYDPGYCSTGSDTKLMIKRTTGLLLKRILIAMLAALALVYCSDYLYLRVRMLHPKPADPFESLNTLRVLAIPEKNGKTEYEIDAQNPELTVTCVHSIFPHSGYLPCWYVKPRINQPIPM